MSSDLSPAELASLRRKKNADAQAAFRSRRANYIANLEETVTRLEYVVRQLQNSCREARDLAEETKQDNVQLRASIASMRQAERERERVWRALNARANPQSLSDTSSDSDALVPLEPIIEFRALAYPPELVHQLPSPADTMNALPTYDAYNQNMITYPLFDHDQWTPQYPIEEPMSCSPGSQIVIPDLAADDQARFSFDPAPTPTPDDSPHTPRRLTRSRSQFRRQSAQDPYPTPGPSADRRDRRRTRDSTPETPAFSDTLAVIKAQAFGTARKTRTRANRGVSEHAARVAMEVLEARGLSLGVSLDARRRRRDDDDDQDA